MPSQRACSDEPLEQQVADALALHVGVDGDGADLGEVQPHHVQRAAADDPPVELGDEELLDVLVQLDGGLLEQDAGRRRRRRGAGCPRRRRCVRGGSQAPWRRGGYSCGAHAGPGPARRLRRDPTVRSSDRCRVPSSTSTATRSTRSSTGRAASASWSSAPPSWRCPPSRSPTTARWRARSSSTALAGKAGVKPIIGCEVYVVDDRRAKEPPNQRNWAHLTLLAETTAGYHNLVKLVSYGYLEGFHYKPRVDFELLERYAGGLIALSGCLASRVNQALLEDDHARARTELDRLVQLYGRDSVYVELQDAGLEEHQKVNVGLLQLADETGPAAGRHRRRALPARRGRRPARGAALHPDRRRAREPAALPLPQQGVLLQDAGRDGARVRAVRPRPAAADARDRRALQRRARARRHPAAALRRAGRRRTPVDVPAPALRGGARAALRASSTTTLRNRLAFELRDDRARWASPTTS